jgi:hypothetical protein
MTRAWAVGLSLALGLVVACTKEPSPTEGGEVQDPPAANARAMLDEARRELADPERSPLRSGMAIDEEALRQALLQLRAEHGAQLAVAYEASIAALPEDEPPAPERFTQVAAFEVPNEPAARDAEALNWVLDEDVRGTVRRVLGTYLTLMMHHDVGMTTAQLGVWMAFLHAAKPEIERCGGTGSTSFAVCVDYGVDVFVIDMARHEPAWVPTRLRWMQARQG